MDTSLTKLIDDTIGEHRLLTHPFYVRWQAGELGDGELRSYAEQYRHFERRLPHFLSALSDQLEEGTSRDAVLANLADEVGPPCHLELFTSFADAVGANDVDISPAMASLVDAYATALDEGADVALAGLVAYEVQGSAIANTKYDGLVLHYGVSGAGLEFWAAHGPLEVDHAEWTIEALGALGASPDAVRRGVGLVATAWWDFLNEREALVSS